MPHLAGGDPVTAFAIKGYPFYLTVTSSNIKRGNSAKYGNQEPKGGIFLRYLGDVMVLW